MTQFFDAKNENSSIKNLPSEDRIFHILNHMVGDNILEIGYLDINFDITMGKDNKYVFVVDHREEIIKAANRRLFEVDKTIRRNVEYWHENGTIHWSDIQFDTVILNDFFYEADRLQRILRQTNDRLDKDGRFIFIAPFGIDPELKQEDNFLGKNIFNPVLNVYSIEYFEIIEENWIVVVCVKKQTDFVSLLEDKLNAVLYSYKDYKDQKKKKENLLEYRLRKEKLKNEKLSKKIKSLKASKKYRIGLALSEIYKNPFIILKYFKKALRYLLKISKRIYSNSIRKLFKFKFKGISVIIPTYKEIPYLDDCVNSVLNQTLNPKKIEIILSVNGKDVAYYEKLKKKYADNQRIRVIYTPKVGLSAARNFALNYVMMDYLTFLDDDDYFTPGYLEEMSRHLDHDISIVCGRLEDHVDSKLDSDTYINRELSKIRGGGKTKNYLKIGGLFSPAWAKLYKTDLFKNSFSRFDESVSHTEDIRFWADNYQNLTGFVYCCDSIGKEALIRRVLSNSMSRPSEDKLFKFWINDRIEIIDYIADKLTRDCTLHEKRFLLNKIRIQTKMMLNYYRTLDMDKKNEVRNVLSQNDNFYLNKGKFSLTQGIAFCHNFSPSADTSAYVAVKRLLQLNALEKQVIKWDVVSSDMSNCRRNDPYFDMFYARFVINDSVILPGPTYFNEETQYMFGRKAFKCMKDTRAEYVYSRSMFAGSHIAAYLYKLKYPGTKWYAEFSDPLFMGVDNKERKTANHDLGNHFLNDFWRKCETYVYKYADVIIFTNEKQREFMLSYNKEKALNNRIKDRSVIMSHPPIDKKFCNIIPCDYTMDNTKINIGYFGSFYANRSYADMLNLLSNEDVVLHFFVPNTKVFEDFEHERIRINNVIGHLEFLNVASKMDYLFINDIDFEGLVNPYLPSKLADYLSTGSKIIAKINENTVLSEYDNELIIKTGKIDHDFALSLTRNS
ncbi:MAG: glycosyltransferase [Christensenellales bacterium]|jgi:glycosyltransferase involved in cell wall biosynthesis/SAM-dependent methyltransferase